MPLLAFVFMTEQGPSNTASIVEGRLNGQMILGAKLRPNTFVKACVDGGGSQVVLGQQEN